GKLTKTLLLFWASKIAIEQGVFENESGEQIASLTRNFSGTLLLNPRSDTLLENRHRYHRRPFDI
ncbi:unnamed protein product, partial [Arabidopsis halleri]